MNTVTAREIERTTITMDKTLLARLKMFAENKNGTVSSVVETSVAHFLDEALPNTDDAYKALFKLKGIAKSDPKYRDKSVDKILYGENK